MLANCLDKIISRLINTDQVGYIKQRFIGEDIQLMFDIMSYTTENELVAILAHIDFEKAFDSIDVWYNSFCIRHCFTQKINRLIEIVQ